MCRNPWCEPPGDGADMYGLRERGGNADAGSHQDAGVARDNGERQGLGKAAAGDGTGGAKA